MAWYEDLGWASVSSLDEIAAELYGTLPDKFVAARDEYVKQARASGDRALASELGKLRRPTQGAWLVNQLVRDDNPALGELYGLGEEYAAALAERDGARLKELTNRRRDLEARLVARADELGVEAGAPPSDETLGEVRGTLDAIVSDPDVAEQVRAGRLVKAVGASRGAPPSPSPAAPARQSAGRAGAEVKPTKGPRTADDGRAALEVEQAARAARDQAAAELAERTSEADQANAEYERLSERLEQLRADVQALAQDVRVAQQNAARAERRRANAERSLRRLEG